MRSDSYNRQRVATEFARQADFVVMIEAVHDRLLIAPNAMLGWAKDHDVDGHYIATGRPMQNR
jgi:hypothetical protein